MKPTDLRRRVERSLAVWVLEAKGMPPGDKVRRHFCELRVDSVRVARTSAQPRQDATCFWGEQFHFGDLPQSSIMLYISLYKESADSRKKKDKPTLIGHVEIPVTQLRSRHAVERWYPIIGAGVSKTSNTKNDTLAIRIKGLYQSVTILPLRSYDNMLKCLKTDYLGLCVALEPTLSVKTKEELATCIVRVLHSQRLAGRFLCELILEEVKDLDDEHLMFRGNSLATKAMESYMKLVAADYLQETLGAFVRAVLDANDSCEVDPLKLNNNNNGANGGGTSGTSGSFSSSTNHSANTAEECVLLANQRRLTSHVEAAWASITGSVGRFPRELRQIFHALKERLRKADDPTKNDNSSSLTLISSSIFLRLLCPAVLSPSLFALCAEMPTGDGARTLTLVAKTLQTLANRSRFGAKENYMLFMNDAFIDRETEHMRLFLERISNLSSPGGRESACDDAIDQGKELSLFHSYLMESWNSMTETDRERMCTLGDVLAEIADAVHNPANPLNADTPPAALSASTPPSPPSVASTQQRRREIWALSGKGGIPPLPPMRLSDYDNTSLEADGLSMAGQAGVYKTSPPVNHLSSADDDYVTPYALQNSTVTTSSSSSSNNSRQNRTRYATRAATAGATPQHYQQRQYHKADSTTTSSRAPLTFADAVTSLDVNRQTGATSNVTGQRSTSASPPVVDDVTSRKLTAASKVYSVNMRATSASPLVTSTALLTCTGGGRTPSSSGYRTSSEKSPQSCSSSCCSPNNSSSPLMEHDTTRRLTSPSSVVHTNAAPMTSNGPPLAVANPLYSLCTITPLQRSSACHRSLPDIVNTTTTAQSPPHYTEPLDTGHYSPLQSRRTHQQQAAVIHHHVISNLDDTASTSTSSSLTAGADPQSADCPNLGSSVAPTCQDPPSLADTLRQKEAVIERQRREIDAYQKLLASLSLSVDPDVGERVRMATSKF